MRTSSKHVVNRIYSALLQSKAVLDTEESNIHIDDLGETQPGFGERHKQSLVQVRKLMYLHWKCTNRPVLYFYDMTEDLKIIEGAKEEKYVGLIPQIRALTEIEPDLVANLANIAAALKEQFDWWWVGFYIVKNGELVVGPFQGPVACSRIRIGRGVCGTSWQNKETIIVPDVELFPGHIACSSVSKSEIVVPVIRNGEVVAVLDADSELINHFDTTDQQYLEKIVSEIVWNKNEQLL